MATKPAQTSEALVPLLLTLSFTTGLVDAISILGLGRTFTANMTGNIVFLGFAVARTPGFTPAPYLVALITFAGGAVLGGRFGTVASEGSLRRWMTWSAVIEATLIWAAGAFSIGFRPEQPDGRLLVIVGLMAMAMGFRNATVRQLKVADLSTTVLTLTITGLAAESSLAGGSSPNFARRSGSVLTIFAGAIVGAVLVTIGNLTVALGLVGALVIGATLTCVRRGRLD